MKRSESLHPLAEEILSALARRSQAEEIVLGGYFALQHYLDYRKTNDIDAWWKSGADPDALRAIREVMSEIAAHHHAILRERQFGETVSLELVREGQKFFSFQIAVRTVQIEPPVSSPWPPILIETLRDNVGSKMNALVGRGAPRDFVDIERVVAAGLVAVDDCWRLWSRKNPEMPLDRAKQQVLFHMTSLEHRHPLENIPDATQRAEATRRRSWFRETFLK
jgi:hypothetical protein